MFHRDESMFGRKIQKLNSVLAGEASAGFTRIMDVHGVFDCRIIPFPNTLRVVDYFRWRNEDACRNALSAHCYWALRESGKSAKQSTEALSGASTAHKNELLFQLKNVNFNDLPAWQKGGIGLFWQNHTQTAENPKIGQTTTCTRRRLIANHDLPTRDAYSEFVRTFLTGDSARP